MDEKEFNQRIQSVNSLEKQSLPLKKEVLESVDSTLKATKSLINLMIRRDNNFNKYLEMLREFNFTDSLTTPSDLFPGIRTVSDAVDMDELSSKTENMKTLATQIETDNKQIEVTDGHIAQSLKTMLNNVIELIMQENQIYDMNIDILHDLDSIYDIGSLSKSTK